MSTYSRILSALKQPVDPSKGDLEILIKPDEFIKPLIVRDLHILLPGILSLSISSADEGLRSQSRKCFPSLKEAFAETDFVNEKWWKDFQVYFRKDKQDERSHFLDEMSNLIKQNDVGWKECWSFAAFLLFKSNSNKLNCIQSLLKVTENAFKDKSDNVDLAFLCWVELIDLFSENLSLLEPKKLISLLITPLKTSTHPKNKLIKITGFMSILEKIGYKYPHYCHLIVKSLLTVMFSKENASLALFHPNECLDTLINISSNETVQNNSFSEITSMLVKCAEFKLNFSKFNELLDKVVEHVASLDDKQNYEEELTQCVQKLFENKIFCLSENVIVKMNFLPQNLADAMMENVVTNIKPGLNERTEMVEDEESVSPVLSPLASGSVFMHRLAKSNEKKAKSCFALFNDASSPRASTSKSAKELSPDKITSPENSETVLCIAEMEKEPSSVVDEEEAKPKSINSTCDELNVSCDTSDGLIQESSEDAAKSFVTIEDVSVSCFELTDVSTSSLSTINERTNEMDDFTAETIESMIVETNPSTPKDEIREKRNRDENETPEHGQLKKPRLENSPGKKDIANIFLPVTTEIPKSFSFGSVTITKINASENSSDNKENSEPNVPIDEMNSEEPSVFETSTFVDEMDCEEIQNTEEKSPIRTVSRSQQLSRAASILRLTQYRSPQVARGTTIRRPSLTNWPSGSQENWIAHGPSYSSPRRSSIKKSPVTPEFSSPTSKKKRVSFNDPPVTQGLLYDPATNFGQIRHSNFIETEIEETNDVLNPASISDKIRRSDSETETSSTEDTIEHNRSSTSSDDSVVVHAACSMEDASTQNDIPAQDMSTQCDIHAVVKDVSTQIEGCDNSKHASTQTNSISIPQITQGSLLTEGIDLRSAIFDILRDCELRFVYKK